MTDQWRGSGGGMTHTYPAWAIGVAVQVMRVLVISSFLEI